MTWEYSVEETLKAIFEQLPNRTVRKPVYHFGDGKEANRFIAESKFAVYPLIYQTSTDEIQTEKWIETDLELVIATQNLNVEMFNTERWATSYRNVLMPLVQDIQGAFEQSGVIIPSSGSNLSYSLSKRPNYSETESKEKNAFVDIVDAIVMRVGIRITEGCVNKNISFNR